MPHEVEVFVPLVYKGLDSGVSWLRAPRGGGLLSNKGEVYSSTVLRSYAP